MKKYTFPISIVTFIKYVKNFGLWLSFLHYLEGQAYRFIDEEKQKKFNFYVQKKKYKRLEKEFKADILLLKEQYEKNEEQNINKVIWVYWDKEDLPELISMCRKSLINNVPKDVKVIELNDKNLNEYIDMTDILELKNKLITKTHFSDILRARLLCKYGGCWLDSTIFVNGNIDYIFDEKQFWSIKYKYAQPMSLLNKWSLYAVAAKKNSELFYYLTKLLKLYWNKYDVLIDYFLIDLLARLIYENDVNTAEYVDSLKENNNHVLYLDKLMNKQYGTKEVFKMDTQLYKLNRKHSYLKNNDGTISVYGHLIDMYNIN